VRGSSLSRRALIDEARHSATATVSAPVPAGAQAQERPRRRRGRLVDGRPEPRRCARGPDLGHLGQLQLPEQRLRRNTRKYARNVRQLALSGRVIVHTPAREICGPRRSRRRHLRARTRSGLCRTPGKPAAERPASEGHGVEVRGPDALGDPRHLARPAEAVPLHVAALQPAREVWWRPRRAPAHLPAGHEGRGLEDARRRDGLERAGLCLCGLGSDAHDPGPGRAAASAAAATASAPAPTTSAATSACPSASARSRRHGRRPWLGSCAPRELAVE